MDGRLIAQRAAVSRPWSVVPTQRPSPRAAEQDDIHAAVAVVVYELGQRQPPGADLKHQRVPARRDKAAAERGARAVAVALVADEALQSATAQHVVQGARVQHVTALEQAARKDHVIPAVLLPAGSSLLVASAAQAKAFVDAPPAAVDGVAFAAPAEGGRAAPAVSLPVAGIPVAPVLPRAPVPSVASTASSVGVALADHNAYVIIAGEDRCPPPVALLSRRLGSEQKRKEEARQQ